MENKKSVEENQALRKALEEIIKASQHIKSNPNCAYILKIAEEALKIIPKR